MGHTCTSCYGSVQHLWGCHCSGVSGWSCDQRGDCLDCGSIQVGLVCLPCVSPPADRLCLWRLLSSSSLESEKVVVADGASELRDPSLSRSFSHWGSTSSMRPWVEFFFCPDVRYREYLHQTQQTDWIICWSPVTGISLPVWVKRKGRTHKNIIVSKSKLTVSALVPANLWGVILLLDNSSGQFKIIIEKKKT